MAIEVVRPPTISSQETCRFPPALATAPPGEETFAFKQQEFLIRTHTHPCDRTEAFVSLPEPLATLSILALDLGASVVIAEVGPAVPSLVLVGKASVKLRRL